MINEIKLNRKIRYTRMVLQDSLIELMREKPITKITIKELCEKADINRTTFYAHYTDQYDLLHKIEEEALSWIKEALASLLHKTDRHETIEIIEKICQSFLENSLHLQVLMSETGDINFQKELFTLIYQECGISTPFTENTKWDLDEYYFVFVVNGSVGLIQHWFKNGFDKTAKEMAETIYNLAVPVK